MILQGLALPWSSNICMSWVWPDLCRGKNTAHPIDGFKSPSTISLLWKFEWTMSLPGTMIYSSAEVGCEGQWRGEESPSPAFSPEEGSREHRPSLLWAPMSQPPMKSQFPAEGHSWLQSLWNWKDVCATHTPQASPESAVDMPLSLGEPKVLANVGHSREQSCKRRKVSNRWARHCLLAMCGMEESVPHG